MVEHLSIDLHAETQPSISGSHEIYKDQLQISCSNTSADVLYLVPVRGKEKSKQGT